METEQQKTTAGNIGIITVPKGKVLKDFRFFCKKHGDITNASIAIKSEYVQPNGEHVMSPNIYCVACLNEYLEKLQKDGFFPPVAIVPVVGKQEDSDKLEYEKEEKEETSIEDIRKNLIKNEKY